MSLFRPIPSTGKLPTVCVFDLDHTLIGGDTTVDWTSYLVKHELVTDPRYRVFEKMMEERYDAGTLNLNEYLSGVIPFFNYLTRQELAEHTTRFIEEFIAPTVYPEGLAYIEEARRLGMDVMIISASNAFLVRPIGQTLFGIEKSIGVELAWKDDHLTSEFVGEPPFQAGKITALQKELAPLNKTLDEAVFFTDSRNDIPLALAAGDCYCVNPDPVLRQLAQDEAWPILHWTVPAQ